MGKKLLEPGKTNTRERTILSETRNINKIIIFKAFIYSTYIAVQSFNINKLFIKLYTVLIYIYIYIYIL